MAVRNSDGSIVLTTSIDQSGLKSGMKSMTAIVKKSFAVIGAAAVTATVAITKMAVSAYADYEQLVGGIETLFKGSAKKVMKYANDAFYTAGVSANEYMRQVTMFSASLIRSTAGDTEKAADIANMALIDISDNVNKIGSTMESVTLAYQGFARQQYILLDNLRLGYGGTKGEMERLLKDAQKITGIRYDINNLADVYSAIHAIQIELGIAGTTAKEAEKTISGSAKMMKAAWQNVLTAIAGGGDLDRAIENLVYSIQKFFENIVPVVERSLVGIGQLIEKVAPMLVQNLASALIQAIPSLINAVYQMIIGLAKGIWEGIKALFTGSSGKITTDVKTKIGGIADSTNDATNGMEELGNATENAGKKAKKSLAAFDDLEILSSNLQTNTSGNGGSLPGASMGGIGDVSSEMTIIPEQSNQVSFLAGILSELERIQEIFMSGFWKGFQNADFSSFTRNLKNIITEIQSLQNDPELINASKGVGSTFVEHFGTAVGSISSVAIAIAKMFMSGFSQFIDENKDTMKTKVLSIYGSVEDMTSKASELWTTFSSVFSGKVVEQGSELIASVLGLFSEIVLNVIDLASKLGSDFVDLLVTPISSNKDKVSTALAGITEIFTKFTDTIKDLTSNMFTTITKLYDEHIKPLVASIRDGLTEMTEIILDGWNNKIKPVFDNIAERFSDLVNNYLSPMFGKIGEFIGILIDNVIMPLWENILKPLLKWLLFEFIQGNEKGFAQLGDTITWFGQLISGVISDVVGTFSGLLEFLSGVFTLDLDKIWSGIKKIFTNAVNGLITAIEGLVNGFVVAINGITRGINGILGTLGHLFDKDWGNAIPAIPTLSIPRLAQGAVIPPNREFLAVLGDQKKGTNIEAPLETIVDAMNIALAQNSNLGQPTKEEHYYLDETELMKIVYKLSKGGERLKGDSLIAGGSY